MLIQSVPIGFANVNKHTSKNPKKETKNIGSERKRGIKWRKIQKEIISKLYVKL